MQYLTDDVRITGMAEVRPPADLIADLPISPTQSSLVFNVRRQASDILAGRDRRLLAVVGPCSIHDPDAAREYAGRLKERADALADHLLVVMRVYFEKPRTTVGWKGLINDPRLDDLIRHQPGPAHRARPAARHRGHWSRHRDGIPRPHHAAVRRRSGVLGGHRRPHRRKPDSTRQLASGLSCPTGFKNSTDGAIQVAADAVKSALHPHIFLSVTKAGHSAIFSTSGNSDCHVILRGGGGKTNFDNPSVHYASRILEQGGSNGRLMVDASHANSQKDHNRQIAVCRDLAGQLRAGEDKIMGVMIESSLVAGRQNLGGALVYGQSITDALHRLGGHRGLPRRTGRGGGGAQRIGSRPSRRRQRRNQRRALGPRRVVERQRRRVLDALHGEARTHVG